MHICMARVDDKRGWAHVWIDGFGNVHMLTTRVADMRSDVLVVRWLFTIWLFETYRTIQKGKLKLCVSCDQYALIWVPHNQYNHIQNYEILYELYSFVLSSTTLIHHFASFTNMCCILCILNIFLKVAFYTGIRKHKGMLFLCFDVLQFCVSTQTANIVRKCLGKKDFRLFLKCECIELII